MSTKETITKEGKVLEALMGGLFRIEITENDEKTEVIAAISGKMRKFRIRIMPGDKVKVEFSPHDVTHGRITYRFR